MRLRDGLVGLGLALMGAALPAQPLLAQQRAAAGVVQSAVLTVEFERLFAESAYGMRVAEELEEQGAAIAAENRRIEAELTEEERSLTEKRRTLGPTEFRALADAFDSKVQSLRAGQDAKARALGNLSEESRRQFLVAAEPVLGRLMQESGAAVVLDKRSVFLSADVIDITDEAIARIDAAIGDGTEASGETPGKTPAPAPVSPD